VDARKTRFAKTDLKHVFKGAESVIVAKGRKQLAFDPRVASQARDLALAALGPSGNLRAPTARIGKRILVGFSEEAWSDVLG